MRAGLLAPALSPLGKSGRPKRGGMGAPSLNNDQGTPTLHETLVPVSC